MRIKKSMLYLLAAYVTLLGLKTDINVPISERSIVVQLFDAVTGPLVNDNIMLNVILFTGIVCIYRFSFQYLKSINMRMRDILCTVLPAFLFAGFMVLGQAFAYDDSLVSVTSDSLHMIKAAVSFLAYFMIYAVGIAVLYKWLEEYQICVDDMSDTRLGTLTGRYMQCLRKHTFAAVFISIFIVYIPYIVISYPAILMGDTCNQLAQGYNLPEGTSGYLRLIDENVRLNGHHPILHTLYMHLCMVTGERIFGAYNIGIFLLSMTQMLCIIGVIAYALSVMVKAGMRLKLVFVAMLYFMISPRIQNYMFLITKDTFSACALLLLGISIWQIQKTKNDKTAYAVFVISGICLSLLRNDGKYIVFVCILMLLIFERRQWKKVFVCALPVILITIMFFQVIMPAFKITPSSRREALSLPFQQTARYIRDYGDEVTAEEREAISKVLRFEVLAEKYVPDNGDYVKENYNENASSADLLQYFKVWLEMLKKHPDVYIEAAMNNYYNYFYPGDELAQAYTYEQSAIFMTYANDALEEIGMSIHYPEWSHRYQQIYETLREKTFELPVLSLLKCSAVYVWILILCFFYFAKKRSMRFILPSIPMFLSLGIALIASRNGDYFRYLYGIALSLPVILPLGQMSVQEEQTVR